VTAGVPSCLDREVRELFRDHPELIAVAEVIASLRPGAISDTARAGGRPVRARRSMIERIRGMRRRL
jgi:hypothetical protein